MMNLVWKLPVAFANSGSSNNDDPSTPAPTSTDPPTDPPACNDIEISEPGNMKKTATDCSWGTKPGESFCVAYNPPAASLDNEPVYSCKEIPMVDSDQYPVQGYQTCDYYNFEDFIHGFMDSDASEDDDFLGVVFSQELSEQLCPLTFSGAGTFQNVKCISEIDLPGEEYAGICFVENDHRQNKFCRPKCSDILVHEPSDLTKSATECDVGSVGNKSICVAFTDETFETVTGCVEYNLKPVDQYPAKGSTKCDYYQQLDFIHGFVNDEILETGPDYTQFVFSKELSAKLCPLTFKGIDEDDPSKMCFANDTYAAVTGQPIAAELIDFCKPTQQ